MRPICVDFETHAIESRPDYPPVPVGVAIDGLQAKPFYLAWGHPVENNTTKTAARAMLKGVWSSGRPLLFHNAKFDLEVAERHLGLRLPPWDRVHDTMPQLFLRDPHAPDFRLKSSADRLLKMPPVEQDALTEWILHNVQGATPKNAGAFIWRAPGNLVGRYAVGDVRRTRKLHELILPEFDTGMLRAYDRERRLLAILLRNEQEGMRVDVNGLERDVKRYTVERQRVKEWLHRRLKFDGNLDSKEELADALHETGVVTDWVYTPKSGKRSTAKKNMGVERFNDPKVASALGYYQRLGTCLSQSMEPWLEMATRYKGFIFTSWNQVRQAKGESDGMKGTRTGRLSCSRFMNVAKTWDDRDDGYRHPTFLKVAPLPLVRRYILPDKGQIFGHRDYDQQELRILAHFEDGALCHAYQEDPDLDVHDMVGSIIAQTFGRQLERRAVKVLNFGKIYGMGVSGLMSKLGCDNATAREFVDAHRAALPDVQELERRIVEAARAGEPIRTWGGRLYYCEPPAIAKKGPRRGQRVSFEYKLLNYLIQGSAADCTKEALIRYDEARRDGRFLVTVHDEINVSVPRGALKRELTLLRDVMASIEFDVKMTSSAKSGPSWGDLTPMRETK